MLYRNVGKDNLKISQLGFGCMRLPILDGDYSKIDTAYAEEMVQKAMDAGVNYLDTAWPYHDGKSEIFLGEFLEKTGQRKDVYLATKLPLWNLDETTDFRGILDTQLKKLKTDYIDFYMLHGLDEWKWAKLNEMDIFTFMKEVKDQGKVRHIGFSFHDNLETFKKICDSGAFDFCQIQLNYMDTDFQAGLEGLEYANKLGIPVVIMEPIKGGKLAFELKGELKNIWDKYLVDLTPAQLALKYLWSRPEVSIILSGMSTMDQVEENLASAGRFQVNGLEPNEADLIDEIRDYLIQKTEIACTACKYCSDCPQGIKIWDVFTNYNNYKIYDDLQGCKASYGRMPADKRADACIECGLCESVCPQSLPIISDLKRCHEALA